MNNKHTELVFILDRSGSMAGLESDTIGGYNAMLRKQRQGEGEAVVTTVLFDDGYELLHDRIPLGAVKPITAREYFVGGCTALLDAVGRTIAKIDAVQRSVDAAHRAGNVLFVITTDGMENASREYTHGQIKALVEQHKREHGWEFLFLGANIDAIEAAGRIGISADRASNYHADGEGTRLNFEAVSEVVCSVRASQPVPRQWKQKIAEDFESRKKQ